jgi:hypothetical protein
MDKAPKRLSNLPENGFSLWETAFFKALFIGKKHLKRLARKVQWRQGADTSPAKREPQNKTNRARKADTSRG